MKLSERELEVLKLIEQELTTEQIAEQLQVTVSTIETHRRNMFKKAEVKNVIGLLKYAIREELI